MNKIEVLEKTANFMLSDKFIQAKQIINVEYPFRNPTTKVRKYTDKQKMYQFFKDGFIDRYSGDKLVNPGLLKVISYYMPKDFPYHPHWKMESCHNAYWELVPTIDHIYPIALGGIDTEENWKLFRSKIADWQESYMDKLNKQYIEILSGKGNPSEKFWKLEKRIREDKRDYGVRCEMRRSMQFPVMIELLNEGAIAFDDLEDFSDDLKNKMKPFADKYIIKGQ